MLKVLIADPSELLGKNLSDRLADEFAVDTCVTGWEAVAMLVFLQPDIVVLDTAMTDEAGNCLLDILRYMDPCPVILALSPLTNERVMKHLSAYDISRVLAKPCPLDLMVSSIRDIAYRLQNPLVSERPLEWEIDRFLLNLGFSMEGKRYDCVARAIFERYNNPDCAMKELYIDVARKCGGNPQSVEKAIRDTINRAYKRGRSATWACYFTIPENEELPWRGNAAFIARAATCLKHINHANSMAK